MTKSILESMKAGKLLLIAGPCVIESESMAIKTAVKLKDEAEKNKFVFVYKSSFDKANRTSSDSFRGPGLKEGLRILKKIKDKLGVPILTDVHLPDEATDVAEVADILQIPALLCRQTDLLHACSTAAEKKNLIVNIKKGQFLSPQDMAFPVDKVKRLPLVPSSPVTVKPSKTNP